MPKIFNAGKILPAVFTVVMILSLFLEPLTYMTVNAQNRAEIVHDDETGSVINYGAPQEYEDSIISKSAEYTGTPGEYFIDLRVDGKEQETDEPTDIVIVYDNSNSMETNDRVTTARNATSQFINEMIANNDQVRIATVIYGTHVMDGRRNEARNAGNTENISQKTLTRNTGALINSLPTTIPSKRNRAYDGGTFTQEGIEVASSILSGSNAQNKIIVTITDGVPTVSKNTAGTVVGNGTSFYYNNYRNNHGTNTISSARSIQSRGIDMYSIGIEITGDYMDMVSQTQANNVMSGLASNPGRYYQAAQVSEIVDILNDLASGLTGTISNGSITDPMGEMVNLNIHPDGFVRASDENLADGSYYISGTPQSAADAAGINLNGDILNISKLNLGADQYINIRYKVNLDTDNPAFSDDEYYATNGTTTFSAGTESSVPHEFEVPTIRGSEFELGGTKVWNDAGGETNRPDSLEIELYRTIGGDENRNEFMELVEVTPDGNDEWNYVFENYPMYSSTGELYDYYINEAYIDGYAADYNAGEELDLQNNLKYEPAISLVKTSDKTAVSAAGEPVVYTFEITNTGNVTLNDIVLNDEKLDGNITLENTTLEPGASMTVTEEYSVSQADIDSGSVENTATVSGVDGEDTEVTDEDSNVIPATQLASIDLVKEADRDDLTAGETVNYTFTAVNDGNVTLTNVSISDVLEGIGEITYATINGEEIPDVENITLNPDDVLVANAAYEITQADLNTGEVENTATVTGTDPNEAAVTDEDTAYIVGDQVPGIQITKTSDTEVYTSVGQEITYTFEVENTGNVTLEDVNVSDAMFEEDIVLDTATLNPGDTATDSATYTVTQEDLDNGTILNTASATGTPPGDGTPPTDDTEIVIEAGQSPSIGLVKSAGESEGLNTGDNVTYSFTATNDGNVTLSNVALSDILEGLSDITYLTVNGEAIEDLENISLSPADVLEAEAAYTVTQTDMDNGSVTNNAEVTGQDPNTNEVTDEDEAVIQLNQNAGIEIVKSVNTETYNELNQQIEYTFEVTNTGNVTLNNVIVEDDMFPDGVTVTPSSIEPGETAAGTAARTVTQEDLNNGSILNRATATGTPPGGNVPPTDEDEITINAEQEPSIVIEKTADRLDLVAGEDINYTFTVTNNGNVTLNNVSISDALEGLSGITYATVNGVAVEDAENITLNPNDVLSANANYSITQTDVNLGTVDNTATVTGTPPTGDPVTSEDDETVTGERLSSIEINKTIDAESYSASGQTVEYTFEVTNTGNVTLEDVAVTDPMFEEGIELEETTLQPGQSTTGTIVYEITQTDVNNGTLSNTAAVTGNPPEGIEPPADEDTVTIEAGQNPSITLIKEADQEGLVAGEVVNYKFTATNDGNVTLQNVNITDVLEGLGDISYATINGEAIEDAENITLNPGDVLVAEASYDITQADVDNGQLTNEATVTGTPPNGDDVTSTDSVSVPQDPQPGLSLNKTSPTETFSAVGDEIVYNFEITNEGNVTVSGLTLIDEMFPDGVEIEPTTLAPNETANGTATYTVTQDDLDAGEVLNAASVTGTPPDGETEVPPGEDEVTVPGTQTPSISLVKTADRDDLIAGEPVNYTFTVTNDGNVTLENVNITDALEGLGGITYVTINGESIEDQENITLNPGDELGANASYEITQNDVDRGQLTNEASVTGTPPNGEDVTSEDSVSVPQDPQPGLSLNKTSSTETFSAVGDEIVYNFEIVNEGNVTISGLTLIDEMFPDGVEIEPTTLAPGDTANGTATYTVTQDDLDAGEVLNAASVTGTPPDGETEVPPGEDEVTVPGTQTPSISLVKTADRDDLAAGEDINYTFTATNAGNQTLTNVSITDVLEGLGSITYATINDEAIENPENITLNPGDVLIANAGYEITQDDVDAGQVTNNATVTGTTPNNEDVTSEDSVSVPQDPQPGLSLSKTSPTETFSAVGDEIIYNFEIVNEGNVTVSGLTLIDEMFPDGVEIEPTTLAPNETANGTATYTVTQDDLDAGEVLNAASVTGTPPDGETEVPPGEDEVTVPATQTPSISLIKTADRNDLIAGEDIIYTFTATNDGNVTLQNVAITDVLEGLGNITYATINGEAIEDAENITLNPDDVLIAQASYTMTQNDVDSAVVNNEATVTGQPSTGDYVEDNDEVAVPGERNPGISLDKDSTTETFSEVGDVIDYVFNIENTGNVTLDDVTITDEMFPDGVEVEPATLAPGDTATGTATYTVTQEDLDRGEVLNAATVTGTPPGEDTPPTGGDEVIVPATQTPSISLVKTADRDDLAAGENINYTFTATNDGNQTLTNVSITDALEGLGSITYAAINDEAIEDPENITLNPGDVLIANAGYEITQDDVDAGQVTNNATVIGTPPDGAPVTNEDSVSVPQNPQPGLSLSKTSPTETFSNVGDEIVYNFEIVNEGNVTVSGLTLIDEMFPDGVEVEPTILAPGDTANGTATYTVTQDDLDAGEVLNAASVTGTPPDGETEVPPGEDEVTVPATKTSSISLVKTADRDDLVAGEDINYTFTATNDGNQTLTNVSITDELEGLSNITYVSVNGEAIDDAENITLNPGDVLIADAGYEITQTDVNNQSVVNTAIAAGQPPAGDPVSDEDSVTVSGEGSQSLIFEKTTPTKSFTEVGDVIEYVFTVTNNGNITLENISITDEMFADGIELSQTTLEPGETATGTAAYSVTQKDIDAGSVLNAASVTGTPPGTDQPIEPTPGEVSVPHIPAEPSDASVALEKSSNVAAVNEAGEIINYTFVITNTGDVAFNHLILYDAMLGGVIELDVTELAPDESAEVTVPYTVTMKDIVNGEIHNEADVRAYSADNQKAVDHSENLVSTPGQTVPEGQATKSVNGYDKYNVKANDEVFTFEIKTVLDSVNEINKFVITDKVDNRLNINNVDVTIAESASSGSADEAELEEEKLNLETQLESLRAELEELQTLADEQQAEESPESEEDTSTETEPEAEQAEPVETEAESAEEVTEEPVTEEAEVEQAEESVTEETTEEAAAEETPAQEESTTTEIPEDESAENIETDESVKAEVTVVNPQAIEELETKIAELEKNLEELEQQLAEVEKVEIPSGSILEFGNLSTDGNNITFTVTDEKVLEALKGYEITMLIDSAFSSIDSDAEVNGVINEAVITIGNNTVPTNPVVVAPYVPEKVPERPEEPAPTPEEKPDPKPEVPSEPEEQPEPKPEGSSEPEEKPEAKPEVPSEPEEKQELKSEGSSGSGEQPGPKPESPSETVEQPESIPAEQEKAEMTPEVSEGNSELPDTGESQNNLLYTGGILALLAGGALLYITRRQKQDNK
ncbi:DUF7507 domain-containing protein [Jeotgalicoccus psychrophilus]|uniref:DUF7507 domain-containing protein n=1 Tax=Jeotgalicoccus psychrophilus TaxID=157228 RepID=UPI00041EEA21|nr:Cna B-type domain-containing protein [Jeotgalicoccus psychrophilus]